MKSGSELDNVANAAASRYDALLASLEVLFQNAMSQKDWRSAKVRNELRLMAYEAASRWIGVEVDIVRHQLDLVAEVAAAMVDEAVGTRPSALSEVSKEHVEAIAASLEHALRLQIERDSASLSGALRDAALRDVLRGRGAGQRSGRTRGARRQEVTPGVEFTVPDRAGRRWSSTKMARTLWRQALVITGAETALVRMSEIGLSMAVVTHPDHTHEASGRRVALTETAAGEPWATIREEVFHPNTHAQLKPVLEAS
jgi:hypothetical protein